jgi:hypothetical protein
MSISPGWYLVGATLLAGLAAACGGGGPPFVDGGADALSSVDGGGGVDAAPDALPGDAGAPDAGASGSCVLTLSDEVGANPTNTTVGFPYMGTVNKGMTCNAATPPTLCHTFATDPAIPTSWGMYLEPDSLSVGTTIPIMAGIATTPGTAIESYLEGSKRWDAQSGTLTIDGQGGNLISFHAVARMAPDGVNPGTATGTFQLDLVCVAVDFRP